MGSKKRLLKYVGLFFGVYILSMQMGFAAMQCVSNKTITKISAGWVEKSYIDGLGGQRTVNTDGGGVLWVEFSDGRGLPLIFTNNLNDSAGRAIYSLLLTAYTMKLPVSVWDHVEDNCDDFDQVEISGLN